MESAAWTSADWDPERPDAAAEVQNGEDRSDGQHETEFNHHVFVVLPRADPNAGV